MLVIELWGLGDLVIAAPFLKVASESYEVTLLAKSYARELQTRFFPSVKVRSFTAPWTAFRDKYQLLTWPWKELLGLRDLAGNCFDISLSGRWDPRDHFMLYLLGAARRFGFPRLGSQVFLTDSLPLPEHYAHRYEYWRVMGQNLGLEMPLRAAIGPTGRKPGHTVIVHTGAGQKLRVWPLDRYRNLVAKLRAENHLVRILCDSDQLTWWRSAGEAEVAAPQTVAQLTALLEHACAFIGNDSGPGHLAALSGVPTFTLFGPQLSQWFAPLHPLGEWLDGGPCPYKPCFDYCRFSSPKCLEDLQEETVVGRVEQFLARIAKTNSTPGSTPLFGLDSL